MDLPKKECVHITEVLRQAKEALKSKNPIQLKDLSDKTVHTSCTNQDSASITIAVILYSLSKIIERKDYDKIRNWDLFVKKLNAAFDLAVSALTENNYKQYEKYIEQSRKLLTSQPISIKGYISDILKKASINKGSRMYEHGLSLGQTSKLLGVSQWELSSYIGEKTADIKHDQTIETKKRARMALEFFS